MTQLLRSLAILLLTMSWLLLSGCGIGPTTKYKTTFVTKYDGQGRPVKIGRVEENIKVKIRYETDSKDEYVQDLDIGGWSVSPPPLPEVAAVPSFALDSVPQFAYHLKVVIGDKTAHGTAFLHDGYLVTCAHCMNAKSEALVWNGSEWIDCVLVKIDAAADVAILLPSSAIVAPLKNPAGFVCLARVGASDDVKALEITKQDGKVCTMRGFDHGASGSPVYRDGQIYGMARAFENRKNWRGVWVKTDAVHVVPIETIDEVLKK